VPGAGWALGEGDAGELDEDEFAGAGLDGVADGSFCAQELEAQTNANTHTDSAADLAAIRTVLMT
jgi:hypothetical protein